MATVLAGPRIGEHVACQRGQSKCVVKFAIAQLITNKPVTLTGYLRFPVAVGLFTSNVEHARRLWFTRDHLAMAQALGWDRVASFYIDLEALVPPSGIPKPGPLQRSQSTSETAHRCIGYRDRNDAVARQVSVQILSRSNVHTEALSKTVFNGRTGAAFPCSPYSISLGDQNEIRIDWRNRCCRGSFRNSWSGAGPLASH